MGIQIKVGCIYTLQFADDQVVLSNVREDMEYIMRKLVGKYYQWGLSVNINKTQYL